jgi:hypothetical protein
MSDDSIKSSVENEIVKIVPPERNEFLVKAQKKYAAIEWEQALYFHLYCSRKPYIEIDNVKYYPQTVSHDQEIDLGEKQTIWESLYNSFTYNLSKMVLKDMRDEKKITEFNDEIKKMKKPVDDADKELFLKCCSYFYDIPEKVALDNKEMLMPFVIGRKYIHQKAFAGEAYKKMKANETTELKSSLSTIIDGLTKDHY